MRRYLIKRFGILLLVIFLASTLNFFLPRISGQNPIRERLLEEATRGGYIPPGLEETVAIYEERFGLDEPLVIQYRDYMFNVAKGDLGFSLSNFPKRTTELIAETLPWTIGLGVMTTLVAFVLGSFLGAFIGWPSSPSAYKYLFLPLLTLSAVPQFMLGLMLLFFLAFKFSWFPLFGGYSIATFPDWSDPGFLWNVARHAVVKLAHAAVRVSEVPLPIRLNQGQVIRIVGVAGTRRNGQYQCLPGRSQGLQRRSRVGLLPVPIPA